MRFSILASGSKGNCTLIEYNSLKILVDCGITKRYLEESFASMSIAMEDIDAVFVTHDHSDHTRQIRQFKKHRIYAPTPLLEAEIVKPYETLWIGDVKITPIPTSHDAEISLGYIFKSPEGTLVYITDTGYIREQDLKLIADADYYILESNHDPQMLMRTQRPYAIKQRILSDIGHLSNQDAAMVLARVVSQRTKEIVLAHLSLEANTEELALSTCQGILKTERIKLQVAKQFALVFGGDYE